MKTKTQHTPTPWFRNIKAEGKYPTIFSGRNNHICTVSQQATGEETEANIDFIVRAVNSHEALLIALRDTSNYYHDRSDHEGFLHNCEVPICRDNVRIIKQAEGGK